MAATGLLRTRRPSPEASVTRSPTACRSSVVYSIDRKVSSCSMISPCCVPRPLHRHPGPARRRAGVLATALRRHPAPVGSRPPREGFPIPSVVAVALSAVVGLVTLASCRCLLAWPVLSVHTLGPVTARRADHSSRGSSSPFCRMAACPSTTRRRRGRGGSARRAFTARRRSRRPRSSVHRSLGVAVRHRDDRVRGRAGPV